MRTFRIYYRRKWTHFLQHSYSQGWVGVGVRCVERYNPVKTAFQFRLRLLRLRSSEIWVVGDTSRSRRTKPITKRGNMHCNWSILPLLLPTTTTWFSLDRKRWSHKRSRKKRKRSDSSDSDSFALMTPLTTPTPTLSLVKTKLQTPAKEYWLFAQYASVRLHLYLQALSNQGVPVFLFPSLCWGTVSIFRYQSLFIVIGFTTTVPFMSSNNYFIPEHSIAFGFPLPYIS